MEAAQRAKKRRKRTSGDLPRAGGRQSAGAAQTPGALAIRLLLERYGLSLTDLAARVEVHPTAACRWLYGARPSRRVALRMAGIWRDVISIGLWGHE
jgi:hypothetical protein